jgi:hypothetical protein
LKNHPAKQRESDARLPAIELVRRNNQKSG